MLPSPGAVVVVVVGGSVVVVGAELVTVVLDSTGGGAVVVGVGLSMSPAFAACARTGFTFCSASCFSSDGTLVRSVWRRRALACAFGLSCALTASFSSLMW